MIGRTYNIYKKIAEEFNKKNSYVVIALGANFIVNNFYDKIIDICNKCDLIFSNFQNRNKGLIIFYLFSFLILGLDMTSLFISMKYKKDVKTDNKTSSLFIIFPSFIEWIVTIVILFLYIKTKFNNMVK